MDKKLKEKAKRNYLEICHIVNNFKGSMEELCEKLNGYNVQKDYESFDANFKSLTITVYDSPNMKRVYEYIDIWNDKTFNMVKEGMYYAELFD